MAHTNTAIDSEVHGRMKTASALLGYSLQAAQNEACEEWLSRKQPEIASKAEELSGKGHKRSSSHKVTK